MAQDIERTAGAVEQPRQEAERIAQAPNELGRR